MVDDLDSLMAQADSSDGSDASPEQPDGQAPSGTDWEARFKGLQRSLSDRDQELAAIRAALEEQRLAAMPEDQRETFLKQEYDRKVLALRQENELLKLEREFPPEVFTAYKELLGGKTAKEQLAFLSAKLKTPPPSTSVEPPAVNKNNPQRTPPKGVILSDGTVMNDDIADRILGGFARVPR